MPVAADPLRLISRVRSAVEAHPVTTRWILAGPAAVLAAVATMMAMPLWFPAGSAGINNVALPILLVPLLWAIPFLYACLAEDLPRCAAILGGTTLLQASLVVVSLAT